MCIAARLPFPPCAGHLCSCCGVLFTVWCIVSCGSWETADADYFRGRRPFGVFLNWAARCQGTPWQAPGPQWRALLSATHSIRVDGVPCWCLHLKTSRFYWGKAGRPSWPFFFSNWGGHLFNLRDTQLCRQCGFARQQEKAVTFS